MASHDRLGLEAIKSLHSQLDDDANGNVDLSESDDVSISAVRLFVPLGPLTTQRCVPCSF